MALSLPIRSSRAAEDTPQSLVAQGEYQKAATAAKSNKLAEKPSVQNPFIAGDLELAVRSAGVDLGIRPVATAEAGLGWRRFFAGVRALVPLSSRTEGPRPHDEPAIADVALLAQAGFRL